MRVFCKKLNPCAARSANLKQYQDYIAQCGHELADTPEDADIVLIWGCGFRRDYQDNSLEQARSYRCMGKEVILAGCIPGINPSLVQDRFLSTGDGRVIPWKEDKELLREIFGTGTEPAAELDDVKMTLASPPLCLSADEYKRAHPGKDACYLDEHIKAFVSEGCSLTCSYCSERLMFPEYQSYPMKDIVDAVAAQVADFSAKYPQAGRIPVMLQADSVGDYGKDIGTSLPALLEELLRIDPKVKVGLQGFNPAHFIEYGSDMMRLIREGKIFHLRLPIQNGSDRILELMGRKYRVKDIRSIFDGFRSIGYKGFSTDIIIGFPGETEESFDETVRLILEYMPKYILLSAYMDFDRLPSFQLPGKVDEQTKAQRLKRASDLFVSKGIYCSTDGGTMTDARRQRMNSDYRIM